MQTQCVLYVVFDSESQSIGSFQVKSHDFAPDILVQALNHALNLALNHALKDLQDITRLILNY